MNHKTLNAALLWKQLEDVLVPALRLSLTERAVYCHLLRHTLLEGKSHLRFSIAWLSRGTRISSQPTRQAVRRLAAHGALRVLQLSKAGHLIEVRPPTQVPGVSPHPAPAETKARLPRQPGLEDLDFLHNKALRDALHARERGLCFYCLRHLTAAVRCLDHVVPQVRSGRNSYRNLVSCCLECNSHKRDQPASDFLRRLYRERRLSGHELTARLRALDALVAGKLLPSLPASSARRPVRHL